MTDRLGKCCREAAGGRRGDDEPSKIAMGGVEWRREGNPMATPGQGRIERRLARQSGHVLGACAAALGEADYVERQNVAGALY